MLPGYRHGGNGHSPPYSLGLLNGGCPVFLEKEALKANKALVDAF